jgi:hypothetical protein
MTEEERIRIEQSDPQPVSEIVISVVFALAILALLVFILCGVL